MEGFSLLVVFCISMFLGAYAAGAVPLMFTYNIAKLRWVTIFGAGLLVGTALIVIIPEGVAMHYESQMKHDHSPAVTHLPPGVKVAPSGIEELSDDQGGEAPPAAAAAHAHEALDHSGHGHRRVLLSSQQQQAEAGAEALGAAVSSFVDSLSSGVSAAVRSARGLSAVADDNAAASSSQQQHGRSLRRKKGGRKDSGSSSGGEGSGTNAADIGAVAAAAEEPEEHDEGDETTVVTEPPGAHAGTTGDASAPAGGAGAEEDDSYHGSAHGGHAHGVGGGAGGAGGGVDGHQHPGHWQIGAALALGFAFQVIVDKLAGGLHSHGGPDDHGHGHGGALPSSGSVASFTGRRADGGKDSAEEVLTAVSVLTSGVGGVGVNGGAGSTPLGSGAGAAGGGGGFVSDAAAKSKSALAGLIVHAMVDGMALAAAVKEGDSALGFLVFAAIMLHKAPGAFGMTSYLLHAGVGRAGVRSRLVLFSLAAPTGALLTYWLLSLNLFVYNSESVALCLLFSGGTFLYVATAHVLPEITGSDAHLNTHDDDDRSHGGHGHAHGGSGSGGHKSLRWAEVWTLAAGVLLPLFINVGHGH